MSIRRVGLAAATALTWVGVLGLQAGALTGSFTEIEPAVADGAVRVADINDAGQVTGSAQFAGGWRGFVRATDGTYTELVPLAGDTFSGGSAINADGDVAGGSDSIATLWPAGGAPVDLGTLPGDTESYAQGINDTGWIVGTSYGATTRSWVRDPDGGGVLVEIPTLPGGSSTQVKDINNGGVAVGETFVGGTFVPFTWTEDGLTEALPLPPGETTFRPTDINNAGQIVGSSYDPGDDLYRTYLWDPTDGYTELTMDGYETSLARMVNDAGLVVGFVDDATAPTRSPAAWDTASGDATVFPPFTSGVFTAELRAVNGTGLAIGFTTEGEDFDRGFIGQISADPLPDPTTSTSTPAPTAPGAQPVTAQPAFTG